MLAAVCKRTPDITGQRCPYTPIEEPAFCRNFCETRPRNGHFVEIIFGLVLCRVAEHLSFQPELVTCVFNLNKG